MFDVPADIHGIDLGPAPTAYQRAEALAAEAHGAARSWFLTNGATQGNHALTLALAPLGAPVVVQRNAHASVVDGLVLSGGVPTYVAPEYEHELGMAHGVTPAALEEALALTPGARARLHRLADLLRHGRRRRGLRRGLPRRRRPAGRRPGVGPALRLPPGPAAERARARAPTRCSPRRTRSSARSRSRRCCTSAPTGRIDPARRRAHGAARRAARRPRRCCMASLDAARRQLAVHGEALLDAHAGRGRRARARRSTRVAGRARDRRRVRRPARASPAGTRCGSSSTSAAPAAPATRSPRRCATAYDIHVELATHATMVLVLGLGQPPEDLERFADDFERRRAADLALRARPRRSSAAPRRAAQRGRRARRATPSSARPRSSRSTTRSGASPPSRSPATRRASPRCCRASGSPPSSSRTCASSSDAGARLHGASDPDVPHDLRAALTAATASYIGRR